MLRNKVLELEKEISARFVGNKEVIRMLILNQLHPRSTTLIRAPRGVGKSTLMLLLLRGIMGEDFVVISGASEVKRGEVVGRLHIPSLEKEGVERVLWAAFVKSRGKGIDELNRLNPYTTANIHHLMQFGEVWAYGQRSKVEDYVLVANENPADATSFIHPPPFYDRFDICVFLRTLTLSEKFQLQELLDKYDWNLVESMPQVLSFEELQEIRREVSEIELDPELIGYINLLVRDFQACIRGKENSEIKPPALCEGCHFIRDICSMIKEPVSERATVALMHLAKAVKWLYGECSSDDLFRIALWVFPHRLSLIRTRSILGDIQELLEREKIKMEDRRIRRQWSLLNELMKSFNPSIYRLAREVAVEDVTFAEELTKMEEKWINEGLLKRGEDVATQMGWRVYGRDYWRLK
ncbi:AAA family ATPase [Candidatus Bathyarchaeota archaeon]|nr:AAA family ATPase [Candidatus Bathyarchaeota archaeon]